MLSHIREGIPFLNRYSVRGQALWILGSLLTAECLIVVIPIPATTPLAHGASVVSLAALVLVVGSWLATRPGPATVSVPVSRWAWLGYALPSGAYWLLWLLTFWPGLLDYDPIHQWRLIHHDPSARNDWYPPLHTLTLWAASSVWFTPASLVFVQIAALSALVGWGLARLRSLGTPRWAVWASSVLLAVWPMNCGLVVSLWKDVPYTIAVVGLCVLILEIVASDGAWLARWSSWLLLGLTAASAALYRHNGVPVAFGTLVVLLLVYWRHWLPLGLALGLAVGVWWGVNGPLAWAFGIQKSALVGLLPLNYLAAHVAAGTPLRDEEVKILETLCPLEMWQTNYYWPEAYKLYGDARFQMDKLPNVADQVWPLLGSLTWRDPGPTLRHMLLTGASVWQVTHPDEIRQFGFYCIVLKLSNEGELIWVDPSPESTAWLAEHVPELRPQSVLPALQTPLATVVWWTFHYELDWLTWRSACFLYVLLAGAILAALRARTGAAFLVLMPLFLQSLVLLPVFVSPAARYQSPMHLGALLFLGWLYFGIPLRQTPARPGG